MLRFDVHFWPHRGLNGQVGFGPTVLRGPRRKTDGPRKGPTAEGGEVALVGFLPAWTKVRMGPTETWPAAEAAGNSG